MQVPSAGRIATLIPAPAVQSCEETAATGVGGAGVFGARRSSAPPEMSATVATVTNTPCYCIQQPISYDRRYLRPISAGQRMVVGPALPPSSPGRCVRHARRTRAATPGVMRSCLCIMRVEQRQVAAWIGKFARGTACRIHKSLSFDSCHYVICGRAAADPQTSARCQRALKNQRNHGSPAWEVPAPGLHRRRQTIRLASAAMHAAVGLASVAGVNRTG